MSDLIKREDAMQVAFLYPFFSDALMEEIKAIPSAEITEKEVLDYCRPRLLMLVAKEAFPSADRPQGEWIRDRYWSRGVGMGEDYGFFYKCSLCEYEVENGYTRCGFNYCPYCGADMRKGADDE